MEGRVKTKKKKKKILVQILKNIDTYRNSKQFLSQNSAFIYIYGKNKTATYSVDY
jgi:hypothetical protein